MSAPIWEKGNGVNELTPNQKDVMKKILEELRKLH